MNFGFIVLGMFLLLCTAGVYRTIFHDFDNIEPRKLIILSFTGVFLITGTIMSFIFGFLF